MTLVEALEELRELNEEVPIPLRRPTEAQVADAEKELGIELHPHLRRYLLEASDIVFSTLEPVTVADSENPTYFVKVARDAWEKMDLPRELVPFCEDNGDYYCLNKKGEAVFWSHNDSAVTEKWKNLAAWIEEVWIGESDE